MCLFVVWLLGNERACVFACIHLCECMCMSPLEEGTQLSDILRLLINIQNLQRPFPGAPKKSASLPHTTNTIRLPLSTPSLPLGRVSPCRQVHAPVAAKVPTCPPYARLRSASLLLPLPTRIQLAGPPQICSCSPRPILPHTHQYPPLAFLLPYTPLTSSLLCQFFLLSHTKR